MNPSRVFSTITTKLSNAIDGPRGIEKWNKSTREGKGTDNAGDRRAIGRQNNFGVREVHQYGKEPRSEEGRHGDSKTMRRIMGSGVGKYILTIGSSEVGDVLIGFSDPALDVKC